MKSKPYLIDLPKIRDNRGNLSVIEQMKDAPFAIARTYWIYDVPGGVERRGHGYRRNEEIIVALSGSFDLTLTDGTHHMHYTLNRSYYGLYVPAGWWRALDNFSTNSVALVLASTPYAPHDYFYSPDGSDTPDLSDDTQAPARPSQPSSGLTLQAGRVCLPKVAFHEGSITAINNLCELPFATQRVFYTYDIPGGVSRGAHCHKHCHQLLVAVSGSFSVLLDDGIRRQVFTLSRPWEGLLVPAGIWSQEIDFSSGSVCLALASDLYDAGDYISDYQDYTAYVGQRKEALR